MSDPVQKNVNPFTKIGLTILPMLVMAACVDANFDDEQTQQPANVAATATATPAAPAMFLINEIKRDSDRATERAQRASQTASSASDTARGVKESAQLAEQNARDALSAAQQASNAAEQASQSAQYAATEARAAALQAETQFRSFQRKP